VRTQRRTLVPLHGFGYPSRMSLEEIYEDLDAIARHIGELDENAVRDASAILARPRYAESEEPVARLVADLWQIVEAIPNYPVPDGRTPSKEWSVYNFGTYARRYFSLEEAGTNLTHRRTFGGKLNAGGPFLTWIGRAVLFRVAAGLIELELDTVGGGLHNQKNEAYEIETVRVVSSFRHGVTDTRRMAWLPFDWFRCRPYVHTIDYAIRILEKCEWHTLDLPFPARGTKVMGSSGRTNIGWNVTGDQKVPCVTFCPVEGLSQVGDLIHIKIVYRPLVVRASLTIAAGFRVRQSVGELILEIEPTGSRWSAQQDKRIAEGEWTVAGPDVGGAGKRILGVDDPTWRCVHPKRGVYILYGDPAGTRQAREEHWEASLDNIENPAVT
jgi:hypothetical protein